MFQPQEVTIKSVEWSGEGLVIINTDDGSTFAGMKRKDFYGPDDSWEKRIVPGARLRYWTIQWSRVVGVEWWDGLKWDALWVHGNDFPPKAEREASSNAYARFIEEEGKKIAIMIDAGKTLEEIDGLVADGHTGNTYGWALNLGIQDAKDRDKAEIIRKTHNAIYGVKDSDGVVNPAILTIGK